MFRVILFSVAGAGLVIIAGYGIYKCVQYCMEKKAESEVNRAHIEEEKYFPMPLMKIE